MSKCIICNGEKVILCRDDNKGDYYYEDCSCVIDFYKAKASE